MSDLEMEMAKALEGKFFWEHSRDPDEQMAPAQREIRAAQKKHRPKITDDKFDINVSLDDRVAKITNMIKTQIKMVGYMDPFNILKLAVGLAHDVNPALITVRTNNQTVAKPKHHYYWTCLRHFPALSISEISRQIGRDHSVIFHSREKWEKIKAGFTEEIEIVDRVMESIKCG